MLYCLVVFISLVGNGLANVDSSIPGEVSKQKCKEYAKYVPADCSISNSDLTLGNSFATREEFPHMVIIGYKENDNEEYAWITSGSLISEDFVLVAAHAIATPGKVPVVVKVGVTDLNNTSHQQIINIKKAFKHPNYTRPSAYNDIGLLKLERKVDINRFARPACLYTEKDIDAEKVINTGWGPTEFAGEFNSNLQKVVLELFDEESCNKKYIRHHQKIADGIKYETMICAGTKSIVSIQARSGGPLVVPHKETGSKCLYDIVGVASFGKAGGLQPDIPDVYTRVASYISWIEENVWK